jgi:FkbM family methyltransferase
MFADYLGIKIRKGEHGEQDAHIVREVVRDDSYRLDARALVPHQVSYVIDVGAHIGTFAKIWKMRQPFSKIICVEVCPENWDALAVNTTGIAYVERAACTYESGPLSLRNSVMAGGTATGGSIVVPQSTHDAPFRSDEYWDDTRPIKKVTLEELMKNYNFPRIDCLKLDCEGGEFSILENTTCLDRVGFIVGEYHGREAWDELRNRDFSDWSYCDLTGGGTGLFHLQNPRWESDFKFK